MLLQGKAPRPVFLPRAVGRRVALPRGTTVIAWLFVLPFLMPYVLFHLWPILLGLAMSLSDWSLLGSAHYIGLANYRELVRDGDFWASVRHTLAFTLISSPVVVVLALVMALLTNRLVRGQALFRAIFFAPFILPVSVATGIWVFLFQPKIGLFSSSWLAFLSLGNVQWITDRTTALPSTVAVATWHAIGFYFVLFLAGLQEIPRDLREAAALDGAGRWARLRDVTLPLLRRVTALVVFFQILGAMQVFAHIQLVTEGGPLNSTRPVVQYVYEQGFQQFRLGYAAALSYVFFGMILLVLALQFALVNRRKEA